MELKNQAFLSKRDGLWIALALLAAGALFLLGRTGPQGQRAVVEVDGREVLACSLASMTGPEEYPIAGAGDVALVVEIGPEGARVVSSSCPDQTCVGMGRLTRGGDAALCLPGRVVLRIEGRTDADAQTY